MCGVVEVSDVRVGLTHLHAISALLDAQRMNEIAPGAYLLNHQCKASCVPKSHSLLP